ncbi:uncharacterized protein LOC124196578 [Daphnia pulex]|uniref:uncharacterized protein LOC124196578 n=1 Tax=Daphnia pulex TaxID=6669 RepID=UPI001EE0D11A|nr:uncharacterized protein LOC124196578 [Daphnia pulex]
MENSGGSSLKRQLPSKQIRRSSGGGGRTTDCSRGWSAKLSLMLFFLAYVSLGAYVFMLIEASSSSASHPFHQHTPPTEEIRTALSGTGLSTTSEPTAITTDNGAAGEDVTQMKELMTRQVLDKLWDITENLNILYKENWTRLAAGEIYRFHETMYLWMKKDCSNDRRKSQEMTAVGQATTAATPRAAGTAAGHNRQTTTAVKWNYPTAFLYALSVITTLGSCPVIPESNEGKILTILFAAFGIPLLLFYLTVVGSALSSCLMCCPLLNSRKTGGGGRRRREHGSSHMSAVPAVVMTTRHDSTSFSHQHHQPANELLFHHQQPMKSSVVVKDDESIEASTSSTSSSSADYRRLVGRIRSFWPPIFCLILVLLFVACGTLLFSFLMSLPATDALLLSFMLLTTTGIPDAHSAVWSGQSSWPLVAVSIYIFLALTLCSICFNLIYEWLLAQWTSSASPCDPSAESDSTRRRSRSGSFRS